MKKAKQIEDISESLRITSIGTDHLTQLPSQKLDRSTVKLQTRLVTYI